MATPSPSAPIYPIVKVTIVVELLTQEGASLEGALEETGIAPEDLHSPAARVSIGQVLRCYRNVWSLMRDPQFPYRAGRRFHLSMYGLYGFAMLCSPDYRTTCDFAVRYHRLATPLSVLSIGEDGADAWWSMDPLAHPLVDAGLYRFIIELQCGILTSLHRDMMGPSFAPKAVRLSYAAPADSASYAPTFGCPVLFGEPDNRLAYDRSWLDRPAEQGNPVVFADIVALCDALLHELELKEGVAGRVRRELLQKAPGVPSFEAVAAALGLSPRTLRRRLSEEQTSYRKIVDELRAELAIRYLRETDLSLDEIAATLGFSETAAFRHAFRRWTRASPGRFRALATSATGVPGS